MDLNEKYSIKTTEEILKKITKSFHERLIQLKCNTDTRIDGSSLIDYFNFNYTFIPDKQNNKLLCKLLAIIPNVIFTVKPIKRFAVVTTPMSIQLLQKSHRGFETGFLTLDQEGRIVPLDQNDPKVKVYTLI